MMNKNIALSVGIILLLGALSTYSHADQATVGYPLQWPLPKHGAWACIYSPLAYPGFVAETPIVGFAPLSDRPIFEDIYNDSPKAPADFKRLVSKQPWCLADWVGLMTCTSQDWRRNLQDIQEMTTPMSYNDKFKLATLTLFTWSVDDPMGNTRRDPNCGLNQAADMLAKLWKIRHDPMVGLMLSECLEKTQLQYSNPQWQSHGVMFNAYNIWQRLFQEYAGIEAFNKFNNDMQVGFKNEPPSPLMSAPTKWNSLVSLIYTCRDRSSGTGIYYKRDSSGKLVPDYTVPPDQTRLAYLDTWANSLKKSLGIIR